MYVVLGLVCVYALAHIITGQQCNDVPLTKDVYKGRFFDATAINLTMPCHQRATSTIYGCRQLCHTHPACVAVSFNRSLAATRNCRLFNDTNIQRSFVHRKESDVILLLPMECGQHSTVNGSWSQWHDVGTTCYVTCGGGVIEQHRDCASPPPYCNGDACVGSEHQSRDCETLPCPAIGTAWSEWQSEGECSVTCGGGNQTMSRDKQCGGDADDCLGHEHKTVPCGIHACNTTTFRILQQTYDYDTAVAECGGELFKMSSGEMPEEVLSEMANYAKYWVGCSDAYAHIGCQCGEGMKTYVWKRWSSTPLSFGCATKSASMMAICAY